MIRKHLWIKDLLDNIKQKFDKIKDTEVKRQRDYSLTDCLMSGLAMFGMKYPSLLQFDNDARNKSIVKSNLSSLYQVSNAPCDTQLAWFKSSEHSCFDKIAKKLDTIKVIE